MIASVTHHGHFTVVHRGDALQQKTLGVARIAHDDDLAYARLPARREHEETISLP